MNGELEAGLGNWRQKKAGDSGLRTNRPPAVVRHWSNRDKARLTTSGGEGEAKPKVLTLWTGLVSPPGKSGNWDEALSQSLNNTARLGRQPTNRPHRLASFALWESGIGVALARRCGVSPIMAPLWKGVTCVFVVSCVHMYGA